MNRERITSRKNPLLQQLRRLLQSRGAREAAGEYIADGTKLLAEAVRWIPERLRTVVVTESVDPGELPPHVRLVEVPDDVMAQLSPSKTPQGALFTCALPSMEAPSIQPGTLILDGIQDPGNLGTILRTADAWDRPVVLTPGCCDAYSHKTVRASMGAVFRTPPGFMTQEEVYGTLLAAGIPLYVTALTSDALDVRQVALSKGAVVIGSEGKGVGEYFRTHADQTLIIPMTARCESLNAAVAAAVVLWQMLA
mgnify:FL=1